MHILVTGGKGFVGRALSRELGRAGHTVVVTTRHPASAANELTWNPPEPIPPETISAFDAVVNLAGEPVAPARWSRERKKRILSSRIDTTHALVQSMRQAEPRPGVFVSASAVGYYGPRGDEYVTEETPAGAGFLADVCVKWEAGAFSAREFGIRVVTVRIGAVLGADGGALPRMILPFKLFLGGPIGSGRQWFSWIHIDDVAGIIRFALENESLSGPVNATAPEPVTNRDFSSALGRVLHRPSCLPVPGRMIRLIFGEMGEMLLSGQRVLPGKAVKAGYRFKYADLHEALKAILCNSPAASHEVSL